jgi:[ribosomal protein S18]-alanine N-acetyltransferase
MTLDVRVATESDLDELVLLDAACFTRAWARPAWNDELMRGGVLIAGRPVLALACAAVLADICELRRIAVHPSVRRAGMARDLLRAIIDHAGHSGCARIELEVAASNEPALALYRAHGFEQVGRRPGYYREPLDDALLMNLELPVRTSS